MLQTPPESESRCQDAWGAAPCGVTIPETGIGFGGGVRDAAAGWRREWGGFAPEGSAKSMSSAVSARKWSRARHDSRARTPRFVSPKRAQMTAQPDISGD